MKKIYLIAGMWAALFSAKAQQIATFEEMDLPPDSWYNGSDGAGSFLSGGIEFPISYNADWGSWSGFSVSNMPDTVTAGFDNQYSAITAAGADSSENYAVVYVPGELKMELDRTAVIEGFYVTNSVYAYLSMRDGDDFTKKFGGPDGTDPDYLLLGISGVDAVGNPTDTIEFYLADFRSGNPDEDYIVKDWMWLDLSSLGIVGELHFYMESSDRSDWGMNTPAYFCIDNFTLTDVASYATDLQYIEPDVKIFPNPVADAFQVVVNAGAGAFILTDGAGKTLYRAGIKNQKKINVTALNKMPAGIYYLKIKTNRGTATKKIIKY